MCGSFIAGFFPSQWNEQYFYFEAGIIFPANVVGTILFNSV